MFMSYLRAATILSGGFIIIIIFILVSWAKHKDFTTEVLQDFGHMKLNWLGLRESDKGTRFCQIWKSVILP